MLLRWLWRRSWKRRSRKREKMNAPPHDGKTSGEPVARAPWLTQGYLKDPKSSEKLREGGWLHTGDLATIDADGYVRICDRLKGRDQERRRVDFLTATRGLNPHASGCGRSGSDRRARSKMDRAAGTRQGRSRNFNYVCSALLTGRTWDMNGENIRARFEILILPLMNEA